MALTPPHCRSGGPWITSPIGLAGWHGDYTLVRKPLSVQGFVPADLLGVACMQDYNYQASYYGLFSSNRLGIADAFYAPMLE